MIPRKYTYFVIDQNGFRYELSYNSSLSYLEQSLEWIIDSKINFIIFQQYLDEEPIELGEWINQKYTQFRLPASKPRKRIEYKITFLNKDVEYYDSKTFKDRFDEVPVIGDYLGTDTYLYKDFKIIRIERCQKLS